MEQRLIVGLGNPGKSYEMTRHNIGFLVLQAFADKFGLSFKSEDRFHGMTAKGRVREVTVHLLMPMTYMNESGKAVRKLCDYYKIAPKQLIVVSDDISLDYGRLRVRERGSSGGHNGHKSVQNFLGTLDYPRLRMGIGTNKQRDLSDFVLGRFSKEEREDLEAFVDRAVDVADRWLDEEMVVLMNTANSPKPQGVNPIPQVKDKEV